MHQAGARFLYGMFSGRARAICRPWQMQTAYEFAYKRPEYGHEMRQTGTECKDANVCTCKRLRPYIPYMSVLKTPGFKKKTVDSVVNVYRIYW